MRSLLSTIGVMRPAVVLLLLVLGIYPITATVGTGVSGFGARNLKKTIFPLAVVDSNLAEAVIENDDNATVTTVHKSDARLFTDSPKLWVKKTIDPDALWIQIRDGDETRTLKISVSVERGDWKIEERKGAIPVDAGWVPIEGIYGIYKVPSGILWVLVSKTEPIYTAPAIQGDDSWWQMRRVSNFEVVHLGRPSMLLTPPHLQEEVRQLRLLRKALKQHEFYFVPDTSKVVKDMTLNLQSSLEAHLDSSQAQRWFETENSRPDPRFFWNQAAVEPLLQRFERSSTSSRARHLTGVLLENVIPLTSAFVGIQSNLTIGDGDSMTYDEILISRRSRFRAGTRFTQRGADASGAVANFVETEQIGLTLDKKKTVQQVLSHIQTRGSIPIRWSSPADVKTYRPRIRIGTDPLAQARALRLHLLEQCAYYTSPGEGSPTIAKIVFVNLIDKKSDQGRLGRAFDAVLQAVMDVHASNSTDPARAVQNSSVSVTQNAEGFGPNTVEHVWFDFHAEVKDGKWHRLSVLLKDLQPALIDHGYLLSQAPTKKAGWKIKNRQNAVVRTNCMDCLDRSNVVQSIFGRYTLFQQLSSAAGNATESKKKAKEMWADHVKKFRKNQMSLPWSKGEISHRLLWADNADAISRLYAGTPALKGDFTRTGKRTKKGALNDGMNSLQRYYLNNFLDADRQEGMDLMVGYANFSNVAFLGDDFEDDDDDSSPMSQGDEKPLFSMRESARHNLLGSLLDGLNGQKQDDMQQRLGELGLRGGVKKKKLDLRWLPGDLQSHLLSQAEDARSSSRRMKRSDKSTQGFAFSSAKALEAIDRRAASFVPWWAEFDDSMDSDTEESPKKQELGSETAEVSESDSEVELPLTQHQQQPNITPVQLFSLALFGIKKPLGLATAVVSLLGFVFVPAMLQNDFARNVL